MLARGFVGKPALVVELRPRVTESHLALRDPGADGPEDLAQLGLGAAIREVFEARFSEEELGQLAELLARLPEAAAASGEDCAP